MTVKTIREGRTILVGSSEAEEETRQPIGKVLVDQRPLSNVWFVGWYSGVLHFQGVDTYQYYVEREGPEWSVTDDTESEVFRSSSLTEVVGWIDRTASSPLADGDRGRRQPRPGFHVATVSERKAFKIPAFYVDVFVADDMTEGVAAYGFDAFDMLHNYGAEPTSD